MAAHGARRLAPMVANLERILGIEALCAAQGIEFRAPLTTSAPLQAALARLRADVPPLGEDRYLAPDLEAAARAGARRRAARRLRRRLPGARAMTPVEVAEGDGPVVLGLPHTGTWLPDDVAARLNDDRAARSPTPTGTSTRSTPACCPARRRCARPSTAT